MCKAHFTDLADELVLLISQSLVRDFTPTHEDIYDDGPFYKPMFQESVRRNQQRTRARRALLALSATSRRHRHVLHSICVTHIFNTAKVKIETAEQMEHLQNSGLAEDIKIISFKGPHATASGSGTVEFSRTSPFPLPRIPECFLNVRHIALNLDCRIDWLTVVAHSNLPSKLESLSVTTTNNRPLSHPFHAPLLCRSKSLKRLHLDLSMPDFDGCRALLDCVTGPLETLSWTGTLRFPVHWMFQYLAERVVGQTLKTLAWRDEVWEANIRSDLPFDRTSMLPHLEVLHFAHANLTHEAMREYALKFPSLKVLSCHTPRPSGTLLPEKGNRVLNRKVWAIWREPVSEEEREQDAYAGIDIQCLLAGDLAALRAGATSPPPVVGGYQPVVSTWLYIPPRK